MWVVGNPVPPLLVVWIAQPDRRRSPRPPDPQVAVTAQDLRGQVRALLPSALWGILPRRPEHEEAGEEALLTHDFAEISEEAGCICSHGSRGLGSRTLSARAGSGLLGRRVRMDGFS